MKQIHNPKILWLECAAGNNALDYQLIGVLAYLIAKHPKASFCIYSNDRDYEDTIDFWKSRGIKIRRKGFADKNKKKAQVKKNRKVKLLLEKTASDQSLEDEISESEKLTEEQYVTELAKSLPVSNLGGWYHSLTAVLGQERGRGWYLKIRDDVTVQTVFSGLLNADETFQGVHLTATALKAQGLDVAMAEDAYKIIRSHNRKN